VEANEPTKQAGKATKVGTVEWTPEETRPGKAKQAPKLEEEETRPRKAKQAPKLEEEETRPGKGKQAPKLEEERRSAQTKVRKFCEQRVRALMQLPMDVRR
jgi:hypothetical protein